MTETDFYGELLREVSLKGGRVKVMPGWVPSIGAVTIGKTIYIKPKYVGTLTGAAKLRHEVVHLIQQDRHGMGSFYAKWTLSRDWRFRLELEAYSAELDFWRALGSSYDIERAVENAVRNMSGPASWWSTSARYARYRLTGDVQ